jgi:hypothetical protein
MKLSRTLILVFSLTHFIFSIAIAGDSASKTPAESVGGKSKGASHAKKGDDVEEKKDRPQSSIELTNKSLSLLVETFPQLDDVTKAKERYEGDKAEQKDGKTFGAALAAAEDVKEEDSFSKQREKEKPVAKFLGELVNSLNNKADYDRAWKHVESIIESIRKSKEKSEPGVIQYENLAEHLFAALKRAAKPPVGLENAKQKGLAKELDLAKAEDNKRADEQAEKIKEAIAGNVKAKEALRGDPSKPADDPANRLALGPDALKKIGIKAKTDPVGAGKAVEALAWNTGGHLFLEGLDKDGKTNVRAFFANASKNGDVAGNKPLLAAVQGLQSNPTLSNAYFVSTKLDPAKNGTIKDLHWEKGKWENGPPAGVPDSNPPVALANDKDKVTPPPGSTPVTTVQEATQKVGQIVNRAACNNCHDASKPAGVLSWKDGQLWRSERLVKKDFSHEGPPQMQDKFTADDKKAIQTWASSTSVASGAGASGSTGY